jgi:hypothetical protein
VKARLTVALLAAASVVALASVPSVSRDARAAAAKGPNLEVLTIHATKSDAGTSIDDALKPLIDPKREPFNRFNSYKVVDKKVFPFEENKPVTYAIVDGSTLKATLLGVGVEKNEKRYHVGAEIDTAKDAPPFLKLEVTAGQNETFFATGQKYQGGKLLLGMTVRP